MILTKNTRGSSDGKKQKAPVVTSGFLAIMGALHFVKPEHFDRIVPRALPGSARFYTYASGVAELGVAGLLAVPKTRRAGSLSAIALYAAVFPANVQMAWDWRNKSVRERAIAYGRLPLQIPLIRSAWKIYQNA